MPYIRRPPMTGPHPAPNSVQPTPTTDELGQLIFDNEYSGRWRVRGMVRHSLHLARIRPVLPTRSRGDRKESTASACRLGHRDQCVRWMDAHWLGCRVGNGVPVIAANAPICCPARLATGARTRCAVSAASRVHLADGRLALEILAKRANLSRSSARSADTSRRSPDCCR